MEKITVIDRKTKREFQEKVHGERSLLFLYGNGHLFSRILAYIIAKFSFFSHLYGMFQKSFFSRKKIKKFVEDYEIREEEFQKSLSEFTSFNDFFIRRLKPGCRPVVSGSETAVLPADGRYLVFQNLFSVDGFYVKGQKFSLESFLKSRLLANEYQRGAMAIARLNPTDYHRFHFPVDCVPSDAERINGLLYSVNPIALRKNISIFSENKRKITSCFSDLFGRVLMIEVGATNVGTIHQTYTPEEKVQKGEEKGYFSIGGSAIVLLFEEGKIEFDADLVENSKRKIETKACFGQSLGRLVHH